MVKNQYRLTRVRLQELLSYSPETGDFTWIKKNGSRAIAGQKAGSVTKPKGYISIQLDGERIFAHLLAWFYVTGEWPPDLLDHKDRNRANNRFDNLRLATHSQNQRNMRRPSHNTSGYKGVSKDRRNGRWIAYVTVKDKKIHVGCFATPEEAARAYDAAALANFGEFAALNFEVPHPCPPS